MSEAVIGSAQETAERLAPLLKEYAEKLRALNERAMEAQDLGERGRARAGSLTMRGVAHEYTLLSSAVLELSRMASQLVEHADLDRVTQIELKLRVAELDGIFAEAQRLELA